MKMNEGLVKFAKFQGQKKSTCVDISVEMHEFTQKSLSWEDPDHVESLQSLQKFAKQQ